MHPQKSLIGVLSGNVLMPGATKHGNVANLQPVLKCLDGGFCDMSHR